MAIDNITKKLTLNPEAEQILEAMQDFVGNRKLYDKSNFKIGINFFYDALKKTGVDLGKIKETDKNEGLYNQLQKKEIITSEGFQINYY